ncbi:MAG: ATP-binding protein, partial [Nitrososphaerota archaeon]
DPWSLAQVVREGRESLVRDSVWSAATGVDDGCPFPCDALVLPVLEPGQREPAAVLVAGISPQHKLDAEYHAFYRLIADHLATALAAAHAYEGERQRAEALAEIDRAKTKFFSNVSHEFRTPLTLILGPLEESLADLELTLYPRQRERLELMRRNGMRLLKLVNALLDFTRIEAGRIRAVYMPTDLATATAELASAFESVTERARLALIVDCPPLTDLPAPVYVDREMWEKIVLNLLSNAFKFTFTGAITVALRAVEDANGKVATVELMVRDTGSGIPEAEQAYLFERFHRVEGARARTHEGSGIGLALVQELVHLHGGTIHVESTEGVGTTFFVRLPIGADHLPADQVATDQPAGVLTSPVMGAMAYVEEARRWLPNESAMYQADGDTVGPLAFDDAVSRTGAPIAPTDRARILVADDSADMREYLSRLLRERFSVTMVANGAQALEAIQRNSGARPDLVLADVMMPELDGFGLLRAIRSNPATVTLPVILLSARAGEEATVEGLQAGADDYLVKPFSAREVVSRIEARLEISRARAESERRTRRALDAILHVAQTLFNPPDFLAFDILPDAATQRSVSIPEDAEHVVAHRLAMLMCDVMGCHRVSITAVHPETAVMRAVAVVGLTAEQEQQWWNEQRERERSGVRLGDGADPDELARFKAGEVFVLDMTRPPLNAQPNPYHVTTSLVAPMRAGDRLVGILSLDFGGPPHIFSEDERALSEAVAQLGAVALEREHLLRVSSEAKARELAAVDARRQMNDFLGIATHELRTPLTSVTANVQMALRLLASLSQLLPDDDPVVTAAADELRGLPSLLQRCAVLLERTDRQMLRLNRLVGDLVDVSRIQAGKLELRPEACDLITIVREAVHEQRASWPQRTVALTLPRRASIAITADGDRIGQVVTNLLTNALKYSPDDAEVTVSVRTAAGGVRVDVRDQGPGISPAYQAHLWERFYRVPGIEQQSGSGVGLGLGLSICKTIVERHGGQVGVESAAGKGSTFWFSLPLS